MPLSRPSLCSALAMSLFAVACNESPSDPPPLAPAPPLESVPYEALGSGKVLFERIGDDGAFSAVYLIDAGAQQSSAALEGFQAPLFGPALSPAGDAIAWFGWTGPESAYDIYVGDLTGGSRHRISDYAGNVEGPPTWSSRGDGVVFGVFDVQGTWGIFERDLGTDALSELHRFELTDDGGIKCPALLESEAAFSLSTQMGVSYSCGGGIYASEAAGEPPTLRYSSQGAMARLFGTAWSPSGGEIAFVELELDGNHVILTTSVRVVDLADGSVRTPAELPGSGRRQWASRNTFSVCWLPGGERLVFNAASTGVVGEDPVRANLYVVGHDGSGLTQLTTRAAAFDHSVTCAE